MNFLSIDHWTHVVPYLDFKAFESLVQIKQRRLIQCLQRCRLPEMTALVDTSFSGHDFFDDPISAAIKIQQTILKTVLLLNCPSLRVSTYLDYYPSNLTSLVVEDDYQRETLSHLSRLPKTLTSLSLPSGELEFDCPRLKYLGIASSSPRYILAIDKLKILSCWSNLAQFDYGPISGTNYRLQHHPPRPPNATRLRIGGLDHLPPTENYIPPTVHTVEITRAGVGRLEAAVVFSSLPPTVETLICNEYDITETPELGNSNVTTLEIKGNFTSLSYVPPTVRHLILRGGFSLYDIEVVPVTVTKLSIDRNSLRTLQGAASSEQEKVIVTKTKNHLKNKSTEVEVIG